MHAMSTGRYVEPGLAGAGDPVKVRQVISKCTWRRLYNPSSLESGSGTQNSWQYGASEPSDALRHALLITCFKQSFPITVLPITQRMDDRILFRTCSAFSSRNRIMLNITFANTSSKVVSANDLLDGGRLSSDYSLRKTDSPYLSNHQLPVTPPLGVGLHAYLPCACWDFCLVEIMRVHFSDDG